MDFKAQSTPVTIIGDDTKNSKPSFFQKIRSPFSNFSSNSKKPAAVGLVALMLFALALGIYLVRKPTQLAPQAAVDGIDITLKPSTINTSINQEFQVDVFIDTAQTTFKATAAQVKVTYDPALLELKTTTLNNYLPVPLLQPQNAAGSTTFAVGSTVADPKQGSGSIATLTFKAKVGSGSTQISFDNSQTAVSGFENSTNLARSYSPTTVNFGTNTSPSPTTASPSPGSSTPEYSFTLETPTSVTPNQEFSVKVLTRSDPENSNLWNATITFPKNLVEVVRLDKTGTFITSWTEEFFSNTTGEISLTGGVTTPGFKTNLTNATMATIVFKAKAAGTANINLVDPSNIYRNSDNAKVLQTKRNATVTIATTASPSPSSSVCPVPTPPVCPGDSTLVNTGTSACPIYSCSSTYPSPNPSSSPSPSPSPQAKGDGNNDGKIDLQDLSVMYSKWSPAIDITSHFQLDFEDNKRINSFDYSQLKALLIQLNVIRQ